MASEGKSLLRLGVEVLSLSSSNATRDIVCTYARARVCTRVAGKRRCRREATRLLPPYDISSNTVSPARRRARHYTAEKTTVSLNISLFRNRESVARASVCITAFRASRGFYIRTSGKKARSFFSRFFFPPIAFSGAPLYLRTSLRGPVSSQFPSPPPPPRFSAPIFLTRARLSARSRLSREMHRRMQRKPRDFPENSVVLHLRSRSFVL